MWVRPDLALALADNGRLEDARSQIERCHMILAVGRPKLALVERERSRIATAA